MLGFATYVEYLGATKAWPETQFRDRVLVIDQLKVFRLDALESVKAITAVVTNTEFDVHFGSIAYSKGGSVHTKFSTKIV